MMLSPVAVVTLLYIYNHFHLCYSTVWFMFKIETLPILAFTWGYAGEEKV